MFSEVTLPLMMSSQYPMIYFFSHHELVSNEYNEHISNFSMRQFPMNWWHIKGSKKIPPINGPCILIVHYARILCIYMWIMISRLTLLLQYWRIVLLYPEIMSLLEYFIVKSVWKFIYMSITLWIKASKNAGIIIIIMNYFFWGGRRCGV